MIAKPGKRPAPARRHLIGLRSDARHYRQFQGSFEAIQRLRPNEWKTIVVESPKTNADPMKDLFFIGASFRSAAASERQHLALSSKQMRELHVAISKRLPNAEFCMLSTCNRAEFYLAAPQSTKPVAALSAVIGSHCPCFDQLRADGKIHHRQGIDAYQHLLRVSCGLESAVLGDTQIVQQIRQSLQLARDSGSTGTYLEQALGRALRLGSRVRRETDISAGSPGVSAAICETIAAWQAQATVQAKRVLLIGAGAINVGVARLLAPAGSFQLTVINRTPERAQSLAAQFSGNALPWSALAGALADAQVVVAATSSPEPILTLSMLQAASSVLGLPERKLIVDAGMPPNVEPGSYCALDVVGIDQIAQQQDRQLNRRRAAVPEVERYIAEELALWDEWLSQRPLESVLKSLYLDLGDLPHRLAQHFNSETSATSNELHYIIHRQLKQLLHPHVMDLRRVVRSRPVPSASTIQ